MIAPLAVEAPLMTLDLWYVFSSTLAFTYGICLKTSLAWLFSIQEYIQIQEADACCHGRTSPGSSKEITSKIWCITRQQRLRLALYNKLKDVVSTAWTESAPGNYDLKTSFRVARRRTLQSRTSTSKRAGCGEWQGWMRSGLNSGVQQEIDQGRGSASVPPSSHQQT